MKTNFTNYRMQAFGLLIGAAFMLIVSSVQAQRDMIITQAGEQLRCRIIDETPVRFVFAYLKDGKPYRSEIFKNLVTSFKFNHFDADLPNADKLPEAMYRATAGSDLESPRASSAGTISARQKRRNEKADETNLIDNDNEQSKTAISKKAETASANDAKVVTQEKATPENIKREEVVAKTPSQKEPLIIRKVEPAKASVQEVEKTTVTKPVENAPNRIDRGSNAVVTRQNPTTNVVAEEAAELEKATEQAADDKKVAAKRPVSPVDISETELPNITINQENKFRIGLKGGIGNRLDNNAQTTNTFDLYQEQLLRGFTLGADIAYFPTDAIGFGVVFTDFRSRNSDGEITFRNEFTGSEQTGSISNNRSVKFVGPALFLRKKLDYKTYVVLGLSPGYNFYTDKGSYDNVDYTFRGGGFGAASTLGIDFLLGNDIIGRDIILSFEAGYNYGKINTLDYGDARGMVDLSTPIDLSRLDFTIGLRFLRFPKYFRLTSY